MWNKFLSLFKTANAITAIEPESPDDFDFIPTPNTELKLKSLNLSYDKVEHIFLDHAFKHGLRDAYQIMKIREQEMKDRNEFFPEELEQLKDEYQIIQLIIEHERKDFLYRCNLNHLELIRKIAKKIIEANPSIDKSSNLDLVVFWNDNCSKLLQPIEIRLSEIKTRVFKELHAAGILSEEEPVKSTGTATSTEPPPVLSKEDDIVMDGSDKTEAKKSTLNFN